MFGTILDVFNNFGVVGLVILVLIFLAIWFIKEKIYYIPTISGKWEMTFFYNKTDFNPYQDMQVGYTLYITQNKESIKIRGEKNSETLNNDTSKKYADKEKTVSEYEGIISRGFLNHKVILSIKENGINRDVIGQMSLKITSPFSQIDGDFERQDANSKGTVVIHKL